MQELQQQINKALRKLQDNSKPLVGVRTTEINSVLKATIYIGELPIMSGYATGPNLNSKHLNAILNAIKNYDLTLLN